MSEESGGDSGVHVTKGAVFALIGKALLGLVIPIVAYIALQTVSKPFYTLGKKVFIGNDCYQTVFVVNPGPYKTRNPEIEFSLLAGIDVVDYSVGVTVETKANKKTAKVDGGLPPGSNFFITYKYTPIPTADASPRIVCDGKQCKDSPTFDLEITLLILILTGIITSIIAVFSTWGYLSTRKELRDEKTSTINKALSALIERCEAQADVTESVHALVSFVAGKGSEVESKPVKKDKGNGKTKQK